ncbi:hypothetical protein PENTCL1PPCAC_6899, partial [Pristionchus entomophagus]
WRELLSRLRQDDRSILFGVPTVFFIFLLSIGFGPTSIALCIGAVTLGYLAADWSINSNGEFLSPLIYKLLDEKEKEKDQSIEDKTTVVNDSPRREKKPWTDVMVEEAVNGSLEGLIEEMIEQYVNEWYGGGISHDRAFLNEIRYQMRFLSSKLLLATQSIDLPKFILEGLLPPISMHVRRVIDAEKKWEKDSTPSTMESRIGSEIGDLHYGMKSRENEVEYLRQMVEYVIPYLLDDKRISGRASDEGSPAHHRKRVLHKNTRWPSHPARHLIRELLTHSVLLPLLDLIADPDTINHLLCLLFDPTPYPIQPADTGTKTTVVFLNGLTESNQDDLPDSLLQMKLSDLLSDARLFSMFRLYLSDTGGPVNELKFLADAKRIHEKMQKKDESSSETTYEVWQIYTAFVHESAAEKIKFDPETVAAFHTAVEGNDLDRLFKVIEKTYQVVYARMQWEYVVPFCQSENFMGMLCGSPPTAMDEWEDVLSANPSIDTRETPEKAFSFTQFRNQLFSAIKAVSVDEEEGEKGEEREIELEEVDRPLSSIQSCPSIDISLVDDSISGLSPSLSVRILSSHYSHSPQSSDLASPSSGRSSTVPDIYIDPDKRDINRWRVTIPTVVPVKDHVNGRYYYAYNIDVLRLDGDDNETKTWSIVRRYSEFYVLENKLQEFHCDNLTFPSLPSKRNLLFSAQTREFIDQFRYNFAAFLSGLCKQTLLARSDLLFAFLTSNEEFRDSLNFSTLNPVKMVRKMPSKLSREKGQNLKPFLLTLMANVLADGSGNSYGEEEKNGEEGADIDSLSSVDSAPFSLYSTVYGNNFCELKLGEKDMPFRKDRAENWTKSTLDSIILICLPYLSLSIDIFPSGFRPFITRIVLYLLTLCSYRAFDEAVLILFRRTLEKGLCDANLLALIQLTQQTLFCREDVIVTEQEKALRMELADRRTKQFIEESIPPYLIRFAPLRQLFSLLSQSLHVFQFPCLNKHLSLVLLDIIIPEFFPPPQMNIPNPLENTLDTPERDI